MYSPEGQNKTIPLFFTGKQRGSCLFFNFIFQFFRSFCQNQDFLYPSIHVRHAKLVDFLHLYLDMYNLVLYMQR